MPLKLNAARLMEEVVKDLRTTGRMGCCTTEFVIGKIDGKEVSVKIQADKNEFTGVEKPLQFLTGKNDGQPPIINI